MGFERYIDESSPRTVTAGIRESSSRKGDPLRKIFSTSSSPDWRRSVDRRKQISRWRIVGIGSRLSRDDEIGLQLVATLAEEASFADRCSLLEDADMATVTLNLMEQGGPVILVDAADMGIPPGEFRYFDEGSAKLVLHADSVSTHGLGLSDSLGIARCLGFDAPAKIFAAQPFDLSPRPGLTPEMQGCFTKLLDALRSEALKTADEPS